MNKRKIINDPVYGFVTLHNALIYDIIEHPYFQRLRRIKQLGLSDLVYPGALHTRFHHALGAMHLMGLALNSLRNKGHIIWDNEFEAALIAILLHDIGHGPFSHTLEFSLIKDVKHEQLSLVLFNRLNLEMQGRLNLAIQMFNGTYHRPFFNQLISSQLDVDRLDYLKRDSFFTGVSEGNIGADRIIKLLNIHDDQLVVEEKGIYSVESFLSSRRIMYWQVYLHKTAIAAERMLIEIIKRAKYLVQSGVEMNSTPVLRYFLERDFSQRDFLEDVDLLGLFAMMDDADIWASVKMWTNHPDKVLSQLSSMLLARRLFRIDLTSEVVGKDQKDKLRKKASEYFDISALDAKHFVCRGQVSNAAYMPKKESIKVLKKNGDVEDIATATDLPNIRAMRKIVKKNYLCWPKNISL